MTVRYESAMAVHLFSWLALAMAAALSAACASQGVVSPQPFPQPRPAAIPSPSGASVPMVSVTAGDGYAVAGTALSLRGLPYVPGGTDPSSGFDCSGLVHYVYGQHGLQLPRVVSELYGKGRPIDPNDLRPGDLLFFSISEKGASHVGILIGGEEFVHAPSAGGTVRVDRLSSGYWGPRFQGARRVL
jgi:cell wall-associated NlpC family hydrolase